MKNSQMTKWIGGMITLVIMAAGMIVSSCSENENSGAPVCLSVHKLDTITRHRDSTIIGAEPGVLLVVHGENINGVIHAYFNGYETSFNTNYNTSTDLIISVPAEAPTDSTADNQIKLQTSHGTATFGFKIIAKPAIYSFDKVNFGTDRGDITFKGKNFDDMVSVVAFRAPNSPTEKVTDSLVCEIISKTPEKLVVRVPVDTLSRITFNFTNSSGTTYGKDVFVNADVAMKIFTEDYENISNADGDGKWSGDSWANPETVTTDQAFGGTKSFMITLNAGQWSWFGFTSWWPRFYYDSKYKYLTFAIKGGNDDFPLWISSSNSTDGNGSFPSNANNKIMVAAKVWNYYMIPVADLDLFTKGTMIQQFGLRPQGPDKAETIYVDDVMFVK